MKRFLLAVTVAAVAGFGAIGVMALEPRDRAETLDVAAGESPEPATGESSADLVPVPDVAAYSDIYYEEALLRERIVRRCMKDAGFRYVPNPPIDANSAEADLARAVRRAAANEAVIEALSDRAYRRYSMALSGVPDVNAPDIPPVEQWADGGGCIGRAQSLLPGIFQVDPEFISDAVAVYAAAATGGSSPSQCASESLGYASPRELDEATLSGDVAPATVDEALSGCEQQTSTAQATVTQTMADFVNANPERARQFADRLAADRARAQEYLAGS